MGPTSKQRDCGAWKVVGLVLASLLLIGCAAPTAEKNAGRATQSSASPDMSTTTSTTRYVNDVSIPNESEMRERAFASVTADTVLINGEQARGLAGVFCEKLRSGTSADAAGAAMLVTISLSYPSADGDSIINDAGLVVGAGVQAFCPEHQGEMDRYLVALGPLTLGILATLSNGQL